MTSSSTPNSVDKQLLESLLESDHPLRAFLDNSPAVSWMKDAQGRHVFLSKPYLEKIGVPDDHDWYGKTDFDFWPPEIAQRFVEDDRQVLENCDLLAFEDSEDVTFSDGQPRIWWVVKFPVTDSRGRRYVGGIAVDISEQKKAEEERRQLEQEIARIVSDEQSRIGQDLHDGIGQELTALQLFAAGLMDRIESLDSAGQIPGEAAEMILPLAKRLVQGLVKTNENVRTMSHGLLPVNLDGRQLHAALQDLVSRTGELPTISCRLPHCDVIQFADLIAPTHLYRIAQEAINNAVKHSQSKTILVSLTQTDDDVCLRVVDEGCGIVQSNSGDGSQRGGMGIRIMKYRATLIGANLDIDTSAQSGTTISCRLPLKRNRS